MKELEALNTNLTFDDAVLCASGRQAIQAPPELENVTVSDAVQIFPNPARHTVTLNFREASNLNSTLMLVNIHGQTVHQLVVPAYTKSWSLSIADLQAGMYFLKLFRDEKETFATKLVISK